MTRRELLDNINKLEEKIQKEETRLEQIYIKHHYDVKNRETQMEISNIISKLHNYKDKYYELLKQI